MTGVQTCALPIYEKLTNAARKLARESNADPADVKPIYQWVYRPEMQFSVYDFKVNQILRTTDENAEQIIDLATPVIGAGDVIDVFYTLLEPTNDPLAFFGPGQQFILDIGGNEVELTSSNDQVNFLNLDYLDLLAVEDFLTISIYLNNDSQNILWEFAFKRMDMDVDSDNDNNFEMPDRSNSEEEVENSDLHSGKIIAVNDGDKNGNGKPDYVDFVGSNARFVPVIISLASGVDPETATIKFEYSGSDPSNIVFDNLLQDYVVAPGFQRIWKQDGASNRIPASLDVNGTGGDYIEPNREYGLRLFNIVDEKIVFYIEGIATSTDANSARIKAVVTTE